MLIAAALDPAIQWQLVGNLFRLSLVVCSALFGFWGYRLFTHGVYEKQGELRAYFQGFKLSIRQFGPGLVFAIIGLGFGVCAIFRPVSFSTTSAEYPSTRDVAASSDQNNVPPSANSASQQSDQSVQPPKKLPNP